MPESRPDLAVGVDGCKLGWIAAEYDFQQDRLTFRTYADFASLLIAYPETTSVAIDIPIGLTEVFQPRRCGLLARRLVAPRSSSVFPAPDRRLLQFSTYSEASKFSRELSGKGLTRQSFAIFTKIGQVDSAIVPDLQSRVFEVHPELCFWRAGDRNPLRYPKRTAAGFEERRAILERAFKPNQDCGAGAGIPTRPEAARLFRGVAPDDLLDACIAAWTAWRHASGKCERLPELPEVDARGLRMQMVY